jgi:hypothetical protein
VHFDKTCTSAEQLEGEDRDFVHLSSDSATSNEKVPS